MPGQEVGSFRSINPVGGKKEEKEKAAEVELTPKNRYPVPPVNIMTRRLLHAWRIFAKQAEIREGEFPRG
jgi:hypothetical protein